MKTLRRLCVTIVGLLLLVGCEDRSEDFSDSENSETLTSSNTTISQEQLTPIILGEKLENPFSVENMQKALNSLLEKPNELEGAGISKRNAEMLTISPTDWYICFKVDSTQFNTLISDTTLALSQVPLDCEIIQHGDYLEEFQNSEIKTLYTVVKPGYINPNGIDFEILDEIFIPENSEYYSEEPNNDDNNTINKRSLHSKVLDNNFVNALLIKSFVLTGNEDQLPNPTLIERRKSNVECIKKKLLLWEWEECDTYYYPEGYIRYETPKGYKPVKGIKVVMWRWFDKIEAITDSTGHYISKNKLRHLLATNNVGYYLQMVGQNGQNKWSMNVSVYGALCLWNDNIYLGSFSPDFNNFNIGVQHKAWGKCLINNAIYDYIDITRSNNLTLPPKNLKIGVYDQIRGSSAPLLYNNINISLACGGKNIVDYVIGICGESIAYLLLGWGFPDLLLCYEPNLELYNQMVSTIWHELTHASHVQAMKNRKGNTFASIYWSYNVYQQIKNSSKTSYKYPYGNVGDENWQYIALSEGWSNYRQWKLSKSFLNYNSINNKYPNSTPLDYTAFVYKYAGMYYRLSKLGCKDHEIELALSQSNTVLSLKNNFASHKLFNKIKNIIKEYE